MDSPPLQSATDEHIVPSSQTPPYDWRVVCGVVCLMLSVIVARAVLFGGEFVDEADNLAAGAFIAKGAVLYRDIFSHHFPFPYYWVGMALKFFGKSIFTARLSLVAFQVLSFVWVIRLTRAYLLVGAVSLLWSLMGHLSGAHLAVFPSFLAVPLSAVLLLVGFSLKRNALSREAAVAIGVFSGVSLLISPYSVYPLGVAYIFLLTQKQSRRRILWSVLPPLAVIAPFALYLLLTGAWKPFVEQAITFNLTVYAKYSGYARPLSILSRIQFYATRLLDIANPIWRVADPLRRLVIRGVADENQRWLFTGFLQRASVIAVTAALLLQRRVRLAIFVYLYAAALLAIGGLFHSLPFHLMGAIAMLGVLGHPTASWSFAWKNRLLDGGWLVVYGLVATLTIWLVVRGSFFIVDNRDRLTYEATFGDYEALSRHLLADVTCGEEAYISYYPGDPYINFFTGAKPVAKYLVAFPWIAEISQGEMISFLSRNPSVISLPAGISMWGRKTDVYLKDLLGYLNLYYVEVEPNLYVQPQLARTCMQKVAQGNGPRNTDLEPIVRRALPGVHASYTVITDYLTVIGFAHEVRGNDLIVQVSWKLKPAHDHNPANDFVTSYVHLTDAKGNRIQGRDVRFDEDFSTLPAGGVKKVLTYEFHLSGQGGLEARGPYGLRVGAYYFEDAAATNLIELGAVVLSDRIVQ